MNRMHQTPRDPLERLRGFRVYPDRARTLGSDLAKEMKSMKKVSATESAAIEAWSTVAPDDINSNARVGGMKAGKLTIMVSSASQRHLVDRWLRSGGLTELKAIARVPIRGVDLKIQNKTQ